MAAGCTYFYSRATGGGDDAQGARPGVRAGASVGSSERLGGVDAYTPARLKNNRPCWLAESPRHATVFLLVRGSGEGGGLQKAGAEGVGVGAGKMGRRWAERIASDHLIR